MRVWLGEAELLRFAILGRGGGFEYVVVCFAAGY